MNKKELRKYYREKRAALSDVEVEKLSIKIKDRLFTSVDFSKITSVHSFLPIEHHKEINTWVIIDTLKEKYSSIQIVVPKVNNDALHTYSFKEDTIIEKNDWGIPEPVNSVLFDHTRIDLVLVPLLAFDKYGHRVGYGKGFYDRFFTTCSKHVIKIGLSLFESIDKIEADHYDIPLNFCVTPDTFYQF